MTRSAFSAARHRSESGEAVEAAAVAVVAAVAAAAAAGVDGDAEGGASEAASENEAGASGAASERHVREGRGERLGQAYRRRRKQSCSPSFVRALEQVGGITPSTWPASGL